IDEQQWFGATVNAEACVAPKHDVHIVRHDSLASAQRLGYAQNVGQNASGGDRTPCTGSAYHQRVVLVAGGGECDQGFGAAEAGCGVGGIDSDGRDDEFGVFGVGVDACDVAQHFVFGFDFLDLLTE